jgi:hypothetical protein
MGKNLHMDVDVGARNIIKGKKRIFYVAIFLCENFDWKIEKL